MAHTTIRATAVHCRGGVDLDACQIPHPLRRLCRLEVPVIMIRRLRATPIPVSIGIGLIDHHRARFAAVAHKIRLPVACQIETAGKYMRIARNLSNDGTV